MTEPEFVTMSIAEADSAVEADASAADAEAPAEELGGWTAAERENVVVQLIDPQQSDPVDCPYDIGLDLACAPNLQSLLYQALDQFFSFLVVPLVHPRFRRELLGRSTNDVPFTRSGTKQAREKPKGKQEMER